MSSLFDRPEFSQEITGLVGPQQAPPVDTGQFGVPGLQTQGIPQPPPAELQTRTVTQQGISPARAFAADFATGFGAGPQAAVAQQQRRLGRPQQQFDIAQEQANQQTRLLQLQQQGKRADIRLGFEKKRLELAERQKVPSSFGQLATSLFINGDIEGARAVLDFSRKSPNALKQKIGRDLVLLDPVTLKEIRRRKNVFPPAKADVKLAKSNKLGQIASALLLKSVGNVENARNEAISLAQQDPSGFAAKNLDKLLRAINSTSLRSSKTLAEILLQLAQESNQ